MTSANRQHEAREREALRLDGISVVLDGREVLRVDELAVGRGEVVAVLGPNGSGKSTLLRVAALLQQPTAGNTSLFSEQPRRSGQRTQLRRRTASAFAGAMLLDMSVRANVETALRIHGVNGDERHSRATRWLDRLGVLDRADARAHTLSAGEAQRASLARAFAVEPELIFLDEPFSALDIDTRSRLVGELRELLPAEGVAAMLATHDRTEARLMADRVAILLDGRIEQQGPADEVFAQPRTRAAAAFLGYSVIAGELLNGQRGEAASDAPMACIPPDATELVDAQMSGARPASVLAVQGAAGHAQVVVDIGAPLTLETTIERVQGGDLRAGAAVHVRIDEQRVVWL
ncbi:MAG TPA: ABC transporter ATP-binding protein [Dehalococcoidia bacterium]|nr:ABC transporter ATP-binding protein [Dehalococcoidia bacterium]